MTPEQRYSQNPFDLDLQPDEEGPWVRFTALEAERTARLAAEEQWNVEIVRWETCYDGERDRANAELARAAAAWSALAARDVEIARPRDADNEQTRRRAQSRLRRHISAPEDDEVEALCEKYGYGAVMDAASRLWASLPSGSGAFYVGGCIGFKSDEEARAHLEDTP